MTDDIAVYRLKSKGFDFVILSFFFRKKIRGLWIHFFSKHNLKTAIVTIGQICVEYRVSRA